MSCPKKMLWPSGAQAGVSIRRQLVMERSEPDATRLVQRRALGVVRYPVQVGAVRQQEFGCATLPTRSQIAGANRRSPRQSPGDRHCALISPLQPVCRGQAIPPPAQQPRLGLLDSAVAVLDWLLDSDPAIRWQVLH